MKSNTLIIVLTIVIAVAASFLYPMLRPKKVVQSDNTYILKKENEMLWEQINKNYQLIELIKAENDSLKKLKPKIVYRYDTIFKNIDSSSITWVRSDFDSLFTSNGIK